jgi:2-keto-myo-inositol isomerase
VMCPVNDRAWTPPPGSLRAALQGLAPILAGAGIGGLIEPLGFEECSLRTKAEAAEAIDTLGLGDRFKLVHDTFHHHLCGDPRMFPAHTGLVHISGVEDRATPLAAIRDGHRVLVGDADILGNARQIAALRHAGYQGPFSFEPFARGFADAEIGASIRHLEQAIAAAA